MDTEVRSNEQTTRPGAATDWPSHAPPATAADQQIDELLDRAIERARSQSALPESTYRLQFHAGFTFKDAIQIVPYLAELGITHVYASPYLKAKPGSTHGYDVTDHCSLNPEVGTQDDFDEWVEAMRQHGISHVLDIVPNHVGVATNDNTWWNDVLMHGPASRFANYFDIAWRGSPRPELHDKILLPVLGTTYGEALDKGDLRLVQEDGAYRVAYYDRRFPLDPATVDGVGGDLHEQLERQHYRLCSWKVASD